MAKPFMRRRKTCPFSGADAPKIPAETTARSIPPKDSTAARRAPRCTSASVTSPTTPTQPGAPETSTTDGETSIPTTHAPSARRRSAHARPIPDAAPVTTPTIPANRGEDPPLASLACSRSQYSMSKMSFSLSGAQPPVRSPSATVAAVLSAMSATILASFKVSPKLTMPFPGHTAKRGAGSSMVWPLACLVK